MPAELRVALQGFNAFERDALRAFFRLARGPAIVLVEQIADARLLVADGDRADVLSAVAGAGRCADTVFVGAHAPDGAMARLPRPVDPLLILRELDALSGEPAPPVVMPPPRRPRPAEPASLHAVQPLDVLVVEDNEVARLHLLRLVERLGLRATPVADSAQALQRLMHQRFAFVLLDVDLDDPGGAGALVLCRRIKHEPPASVGPPPKPPQVLLIGETASAADRVRGDLAGCDAYLTRPLDEAQLARALAALDPELFGASAGPRGRARGQ